MSKLYAIANNKSRLVAETKVLVNAVFRVKGATNWYYAFEYRTDYPYASQTIFHYNAIVGKDLFPDVVCAYLDDINTDTRSGLFFYAPVECFEKELIISE